MTEFVFSLWRGEMVAPPRGRPSEEILRETAAEHGMTVAAMLSRARSKPFVRARWDAIRELRATNTPNGLPRSLPLIGKVMGMNHTSLVYALRRIEDIEKHGDVWGNGGNARCKPYLAKREVEAA